MGKMHFPYEPDPPHRVSFCGDVKNLIWSCPDHDCDLTADDTGWWCPAGQHHVSAQTIMLMQGDD